MFETIDFSKSRQYTLSIRLGTDGFSFSIYNPLNEGSTSYYEQAVDASLSLTANLKYCFGNLEFLSHPYKRVNILLTGKRFTLVPLEYFEDDQAELIFYHNHPRQPNETILYNILRRHNAVVLYSMDKSAHMFLKERFPEVYFYPQAAPLLEYFQTKSRLGNSKKIFCCLHKDSLEVYCYDRGRLLLANSFECRQTSDRTYYLLYVWKQLELDQQRDELHLTGLLTDKEALLAALRKFVLQVFVMNPETNIDFQALLSCE